MTLPQGDTEEPALARDRSGQTVTPAKAGMTVKWLDTGKLTA